MKIIALSHIFPPAIDGGSKVVYKMGEYFESKKHQVIYLSSDCFSTDDFVKKTPLSFGHLPLKKGRNIFPSFHQGRGLRGGFCKLPVYHHLRRPLKFLNLFLPKNSYLSDLLKIFQKGPIFKFIPFFKTTIKIIKLKPDLIIAGPLPTTIVLYANFLKNLINRKDGFCKLLINSSFHQSDPDFSRSPLIKILQKADFLWTLTQYETDYFIKNLKIDPKKIILAGNGVEETFLKKENKVSLFKGKTGLSGKGLTILFVGSLAAHKRVDLLIKSFSKLTPNKLKPEIFLTIVGQKTLFFPKINTLYQSLSSKIKNKISFKFNIKNQEKLIEIIDQSQFLVLPSIQESFGLVLIEAWSRKKAVITSDIPPLKELVNNSSGGLTFETDNYLDLQKQIQKLINNPKLCTKLGQNGFDYVKNNYTWNHVGQKICQKILS